MGASGSLNYGVPSGSYTPFGEEQELLGPHVGQNYLNYDNFVFHQLLPGPGDLGGGGGGTPVTTFVYYQRVYDNDNNFWCYYSGNAINASPGTTDTTPNNSGNISGHSIIFITENTICE